jgi:putative hydrolase of the HAD superfamily
VAYAAVIFDLFGTLAPFSPREHDRVLHTMATTLNLPVQEFGRAWSATYLAQEQGLAATEALRHICATLGVTPDAHLLIAATDTYRDFQQRTLMPRPEAIPMLMAVRQAGCATGLISNCPAIVVDLWAASALAPFIATAIFSARVGLSKPDPRIYRLVCERLGVPAARCLYVGDGGSRELSGAAACGIDAVLLQPDDEDPEDAQLLGRQEWSGKIIRRLSEIPTLVSQAT